ncbi:hypothetical protein HJD18_11635 [Thermoleophilia bacterium SCSIO 60948]|nr:hypothetical protein HJD18_11635 [Thermoleophilia bacterium SCSIO 60948]
MSAPPAAPRSARRRRQAVERGRTYRRRRMTALVLAIASLAALVLGARAGSRGGEDDATLAEQAVTEAEAVPPELPRGGQEVFADGRRLVGFYGAPQDDELGELGIGEPSEAGQRLLEQAAAYESDEVPVMPFMELISTVAAADPGLDGLYRNHVPDRVIDDYLTAAREIDALLVLDIQPGQADFVDEVRRIVPYLRQPDVGLALDPEWHMQPGEVPGQTIGSVDADDVNRVQAMLARIVEQENLPQKPLIVHQFTADMIVGKERLREYPGVALVLNIDGFGTRDEKVAKYHELKTREDSEFFTGFKLFYREDVGLMSAEQVLGLRPPPDLVLYE